MKKLIHTCTPDANGFSTCGCCTYVDKPTIREEYLEWTCIEKEYESTESEQTDWWLNKIKEVVGTDVPIQTNNGMEVELKWANHVVNFERQRILKEFGIIK